MDARSLEEVRDNIDRIDRSIIGLMAERGRFVQQAARFKTSRAEVEAPKRVEQVIAKVRDLAHGAGLEPRVAEAAYRAMIGAFIEVEHAERERGAVQPGSAGMSVPAANTTANTRPVQGQDR